MADTLVLEKTRRNGGSDFEQEKRKSFSLVVQSYPLSELLRREQGHCQSKAFKWGWLTASEASSITRAESRWQAGVVLEKELRPGL